MCTYRGYLPVSSYIKCLGDFELTPMIFFLELMCTLSIHSWLTDNPHISEPYVRIGCIWLSNILKKISGECSPIDHRSFTIANIPFLARLARSSRVGEKVSLVVRYIPRYLYLFTISSIWSPKKTLFSQSQMPSIPENNYVRLVQVHNHIKTLSSAVQNIQLSL